VIKAPIHYQPTANATAQSDIEGRIETGSSTVPSLSQRGHVGVILDKYRGGRDRLKPARQVELGPSFDLMGSANLAAFPIYRSAKTDAYRLQFAPAQQFGKGRFDLLADALRSFFHIDVKPPALDYVTGFVAGHQLELRSANLDPGKKLHQN
jgi:hypothetical protein